jgi:hypothetical protein
LLIFSERIFDSSVDRGMPNLAAAPVGPKIRPRHSFRAASMISFSCARSLLAGCGKLKPGDLVVAYMKGLGYVGFGTAPQAAVTAREFKPQGFEKSLLDLPLRQPGMGDNKDDPLLSEWVVAAKWNKTFDRNEARRFQGIFANQNIVCLLRDTATADFLRREFAVAP